jgi:leucine dehydrogenase
MEDLIRDWDGEYVVVHYDKTTECWMFIAVHSTVLGNASGGTRMKVYATPDEGLRDAQRLATGMTYKWAGVDFPQGGGKGVISLSHEVNGDERERLLERYGDLVESLRGSFSTGADLGVGPESVKIIGRETSHVFGLRGAGDPGPWTALGVFTAIQAVAKELHGTSDLTGRTVLVQGLGDVGIPLCKRLCAAGAKLKVADIDADRAAGVAAELGGEGVASERVYEEACDVFAPCAVGGILNPGTISTLQCTGVAGAANNQIESREDASRLHERGILYSPDFICNAGGAVALCGLEALGMSDDYITRKILSIGDALEAIFSEAKDNDEPPLDATERRVRKVLERGPA